MTTTREHLTAIRNDLTQLPDWLRWAHTDAYTPAAPNPDAPRRGQPADTGEDHIRAARYDIGIGNHRTRTRYQRAGHELRRIEAGLAVAVALHGCRKGPARRLARLEQPRLADLLASIDDDRCRLDLLDAVAGPPSWCARDAREAVVVAARAAEAAWLTLRSAWEVGRADPESQAVGEKRCRVCKIRAAKKKGGRCSICADFYARRGHERPRSLDSVSAAKEAQERRVARGEGWGMA